MSIVIPFRIESIIFCALRDLQAFFDDLLLLQGRVYYFDRFETYFDGVLSSRRTELILHCNIEYQITLPVRYRKHGILYASQDKLAEGSVNSIVDS